MLKLTKGTGGAISVATVATAGSTSSKTLGSINKGHKTIRCFAATSSQAEAAIKHISYFFYTNCVALHLIEDPDLVAAFKCLGIQLPGRKALSTTHLDKAYNDVQATVAPQVKATTFFQISTDGWKKKACEGGVPLINCMMLKPQGGALFIEAFRAAG